MDKIDDIVKELIEYNKKMQIHSSIQLCKQTPTLPICNLVDNNNWDLFYTEDHFKNLFSKGAERMNTWKYLLNEPPTVYFSNEIKPHTPDENTLLQDIIKQLQYLKNNKIQLYYFIFAALIILFQVFGDGNHRTAAYFMKKYTGNDITLHQMKFINGLMNKLDYHLIKSDPIHILHTLIYDLIDGYNVRYSGNIKRKTRMNKRKTKTKIKTRITRKRNCKKKT